MSSYSLYMLFSLLFCERVQRDINFAFQVHQMGVTALVPKRGNFILNRCLIFKLPGSETLPLDVIVCIPICECYCLLVKSHERSLPGTEYRIKRKIHKVLHIAKCKTK